MKHALSAVLAAVAIVAAASPGAALAGSCQGTVGGLSKTYDLGRGSGFLAIRARPSTGSRMVGQAFNGGVVEIDRRRGNWLFVYDQGSGKQGWVYAKYVRRDCDGI